MKQILLFSLFFLCVVAAKAQTDVTVFPNPATEYIRVNDASESAGTVNVFNLVGKKLRGFDYAPDQDYLVADLPKGMYLVQVVDKSGKVITTQKINKR
jgi:hypothetical protein